MGEGRGSKQETSASRYLRAQKSMAGLGTAGREGDEGARLRAWPS